MRKPGRIAKFFSIVSLIMGVVAFVLGSAPFTPALMLAVVALPIVVVTIFQGAWRVSVMAAYYSVAALYTVPTADFIGLYVDKTLLILGVFGVVVGIVLFVEYIRGKSIT